MANPAIERREQERAAIDVDVSGVRLSLRDAALDWSYVPGSADVPADGAAVVDLKRLAETPARGVRLMPEDDARALADHLPRLDLIDLVFPKFRDGRAYSSARILRDCLGYTGALRAVGDVLADQIAFMARCGIDQFVLNPAVSAEAAKAALDRYAYVYQRGSDPRAPVWHLRRSS